MAEQLISKGTVEEGTAITTDYQKAGRGQAGHDWISQPGLNIAASIILLPVFLDIKRQFYLNIITSLAVFDVISALTSKDLSIKWPNDVMLNDKKVCGILIKNHLQGKSISTSIVGVGINVNQKKMPFEKATSLSGEAGKTFDMEVLYASIFEALSSRYFELQQERFAELEHEFLQRLYWKDEPHIFYSNGREFTGTIKGIDEIGRLRVLKNGIEGLYSMKEITYLQ